MSGDTYTLPVTDAYGFTRTSVPYGTYSYTVTKSGGDHLARRCDPGGQDQHAVSKFLNATLVSTTYLPQPVVVTSS